MSKLKIAIDVDDVLCAFTPHAHAFHGVPMPEKVDYWSEQVMDARLGQYWFSKHIAPIEEFWKTIPLLSKPEEIGFEIECYMSSFPPEMYEIRKEWLLVNKFPNVPLVVTTNKLTTCKKMGIDVIIDDKPQTIREMNENGILGIHFYNHYAGFDPVIPYVVFNLNQVKNFL